MSVDVRGAMTRTTAAYRRARNERREQARTRREARRARTSETARRMLAELEPVPIVTRYQLHGAVIEELDRMAARVLAVIHRAEQAGVRSPWPSLALRVHARVRAFLVHKAVEERTRE